MTFRITALIALPLCAVFSLAAGAQTPGPAATTPGGGPNSGVHDFVHPPRVNDGTNPARPADRATSRTNSRSRRHSTRSSHRRSKARSRTSHPKSTTSGRARQPGSHGSAGGPGSPGATGNAQRGNEGGPGGFGGTRTSSAPR